MSATMTIPFHVPSAFQIRTPTREAHSDPLCFSIQKLLEPSPPPFSLDSTEDQIMGVLYGSRQQHFGDSPDQESWEHMRKFVRQFTREALPVDMLVPWGAVKAYGQMKGYDSIDLAELLGMARLSKIAAQVSEVYDPGMVVRVMLEDSTRLFLSMPIPDLVPRMTKYYEQLVELAANLSPVSLEIVRESDLIGTSEQQYFFREDAWHNAAMFKMYFLTRQEHIESEYAQLREYQVLKDSGWEGVISDEALAGYLTKAGHEDVEGDNDALLWSVCKYMGMILTRTQWKIKHSAHVGLETIRASFAPYPKGADPHISRGRIAYKVKDSKKKSSLLPWTSVGMFDCERGEPTLVHFRNAPVTRREYHIQFVGQIGVQEVRVDLISGKESTVVTGGQEGGSYGN